MFTYYKYVKKVFKYLCKTNLYTKVERYKFYFELVEYLEYIFSHFRLTISGDKFRTIQNWLKLKKVNDIQFFLDFANLYC